MKSQTLSWQKANIAEVNRLNVLGLFILSDRDAKFLNNPQESQSSTYRATAKFYEQLVQTSENAFVKVINSTFNPTKYNSLRFIASDSIESGLEAINSSIENFSQEKNSDKINLTQIPLLLISASSYGPRVYHNKKTASALTAIIDSGYQGSIIGLNLGADKNILKNYLKKKTSIIETDSCYKFYLERAIYNCLNPTHN